MAEDSHYLVYIAHDSGDSACSEDVSDSRVFDNQGAAESYYNENRGSFDPDCMQIIRCEFIAGVLMPIEEIRRCGNLYPFLRLQNKTSF